MNTKPGEDETGGDAHQDVGCSHEKFPILQQLEGLVAEGGKGGESTEETDGEPRTIPLTCNRSPGTPSASQSRYARLAVSGLLMSPSTRRRPLSRIWGTR